MLPELPQCCISPPFQLRERWDPVQHAWNASGIRVCGNKQRELLVGTIRYCLRYPPLRAARAPSDPTGSYAESRRSAPGLHHARKRILAQIVGVGAFSWGFFPKAITWPWFTATSLPAQARPRCDSGPNCCVRHFTAVHSPAPAAIVIN